MSNISLPEYSLIFLSIVIGYIVTVSMVGWGKQIKYFNYPDFSFVHLIWTINLFLYLLFIWFWTYSFHLAYLETFLWFTLILARPLLIYFCYEVLLPEHQEKVDYVANFSDARRKFFILLTILWVYELLLSMLMRLNLFSMRGELVMINIPISFSLIFIKKDFTIKILSVIVLVIMLLFLVAHIWMQQLR